MKKNEILDVLYSAQTEGHHVEVKLNFGISSMTGSIMRTPVSINGGIFKISSVESTGHETIFKGTMNSEGYCFKEISISLGMIQTVTAL